MLKAQKDKWCSQIQAEYPTLPPYFIEMVVDLYEKDKKFLDSIIREEVKKNKGKGPVKPKTQLTIEEFERLNQSAMKQLEKTQSGFKYEIMTYEERKEKGLTDQDTNFSQEQIDKILESHQKIFDKNEAVVNA